MKDMTRNMLLIIVLVLVVGAIIYLQSQKPKIGETMSNETTKNGKYPKAPELQGISAWVNSEPLTMEKLKGKVVIVDFWTYSCINCLRTLPYLNAWNEKYASKGLVIIGVHTPEFNFEKDLENVQFAVQKYGIKYPIALDNGYATWTAYRNQYWPRKYIIDKDGYIRYDHIGEGGYEESEKQIQELLAETGADTMDGTVNIADQTPTTYNTPEIYAGYEFALPRGEDIGNGGSYRKDESYNYQAPAELKKDRIYLDGSWLAGPENVSKTENNESSIYLLFSAKSANIVAEATNISRLYVSINGKYVDKTNAGTDVEFDGVTSYVLVHEPRLYNVYNGPYGSYTLKLSTYDPGFSFNAFTFG
jgi:thiol-disulfide isomerase/thioredoxin